MRFFMRRRHKRIVTIGLIVLSSLAIFSGFFIIVRDLVKSSGTVKKSAAAEYTSTIVRNVLFISSRGINDPVFDAQRSGIQEIFMKEGIALDEFVLDMALSGNDFERLMSETLELKLSSQQKFDAVIAGDDTSLDFVSSHIDGLFKDIPVVFLGLTRIRHAQEASENPWMTGSVSIHPIGKILDTAIQQNPDARYVTAIVDGSISNGGDEEQFYSFALSYPKLRFGTIKVSTLTMDEIRQNLGSIDGETILVYLSGTVDSNGIRYSVPEMSYLISQNARVPVYTDFGEAMGGGFIGGSMIDNRKSGIQAAMTVVKILSGENVASIPLFIDDANEYRFDFSVAKKFNLASDSFPRNAEWINNFHGFWRTNYRTIVSLLLILLGGILLVVVMAILTLRSRIIQKELKISRKQLEFMVSHDFLTGLPKIQTAHQIISEMICTGNRFSVVKININNFKGINNAYTHSCGDAVLARIASLLMELDQNEYFVARDGSEFIIIYKNGYLSEVSKHFEHLRVTFLNIPFAYNGVRFDINTKMGIFNVPVESTLSDDDVLSAVNYALYVAKAGGKYKYVFFTSEMQEKIRNTQEVVKILEEACENDGFEAFFQPQIDLESGGIFGYESLCRLKNHTISPAHFIPVAENNGFITKIGRIMTEKVVMQMAAMRDEGLPLRQFAINYSAGQIVDTGYVAFLRDLLEKYDIPPEMIEIEITESLYLGKDQDSASLFRQLEELGVGLALDDFGTGYSSISYLTYLPVGVVKIDKTMVDIYLHDGKDVLIKNIINMVHSLGMKLIAEGIEEEWQYQKLKNFDCDVIQGYYFSKPMRGCDVKKFSV